MVVAVRLLRWLLLSSSAVEVALSSCSVLIGGLMLVGGPVFVGGPIARRLLRQA